MDSKLLHDDNGQRTFALIMDTGDEVISTVRDFARKHSVKAAQITGIGALSDVVLLYFAWEKKAYEKIPVREQVEVASLIGDIALDPKGEPAVHIHVVVGRRNGSAMAGHLGEAHVRPTLEVIIEESPAYLQKVHDRETGLALINTREPSHA